MTQNLIKTFFALFIVGCYPYDPTLSLHLNIKGLNNYSAVHVIDGMYEAATCLKKCGYLQDKYPDLYTELLDVLNHEIIITPTYKMDRCAEAVAGGNQIAFNPYGIEPPQQIKCGHQTFTAAHEIIHLVGVVDDDLVDKIVWRCIK